MNLSRKTVNTSVLRLTLAGATALALGTGSATSAETPDPYTMANNAWITINGTVNSVQKDTFTLDYGDGFVTVEMDDGDRDADAYKLVSGDKVTVSGKIDDDFYELTTIEAGSVYVENLGTTFFASAVDEESTDSFAAFVSVPIVDHEATIYGTVTEVGADQFTVSSGLRKIDVEVDDMPYNPLDDEGYQKIKVGDRVKVSGELDHDLFERQEIEADYVVTLRKS